MPVACIVRCRYAFFCTDLAEEPHKQGDFSEKYHECGFVAPLTSHSIGRKFVPPASGAARRVPTPGTPFSGAQRLFSSSYLVSCLVLVQLYKDDMGTRIPAEGDKNPG